MQFSPESQTNRPLFAPQDMPGRLAEAEDGLFIRAESIEEWVASWLTADELPPPDPDLDLRRGL